MNILSLFSRLFDAARCNPFIQSRSEMKRKKSKLAISDFNAFLVIFSFRDLKLVVKKMMTTCSLSLKFLFLMASNRTWLSYSAFICGKISISKKNISILSFNFTPCLIILTSVILCKKKHKTN